MKTTKSKTLVLGLYPPPSESEQKRAIVEQLKNTDFSAMSLDTLRAISNIALLPF